MPDVTLDLSYDSADAIPEGFSGLFDETDGKFTLSGVNGMKTAKDVSAVQEALRKEREDHKAAKDALTPWSSLGEAADVQAQLDRIKELEAAAGGKLDDTKLNELVEGRLAQKTGPLDRQITTLTEENDSVKTENIALKSQIETRDRNDAVRAVATEMKVVATAMPDVEMVAGMYLERNEAGDFVTKADAPSGITPGVDAKQFLKEMQKIRPHWWPASEGGGAQGGSGLNSGEANPWKGDTWNMTQQGVIHKADPALAARLAKAAGTTIGGVKPAQTK